MSLLKSQVQVKNIARLSTRDTLSLQWGVWGRYRLEGWEPHSSFQLLQYGSLCRPLTKSTCGSSPQSSLRDADGWSALESVVGTSHQLHFHVQDWGPKGELGGEHVPPPLLTPPPYQPHSVTSGSCGPHLAMTDPLRAGERQYSPCHLLTFAKHFAIFFQKRQQKIQSVRISNCCVCNPLILFLTASRIRVNPSVTNKAFTSLLF